jgi:small-conductance mechanosensitive channel/CRP-like cAMP-binding protein
MASYDLRKSAIYFVITAGITAAVLFLFPFVEQSILHALANRYGLEIGADGPTAQPGANKMIETAVTLAYFILQLAKVIVWMFLVITVVRFLGLLVLRTLNRGTGQFETSSLIKTVLSVVVYIVSFFIIFQSQFPNVQLTPLFTGSTIVGIVVGLALQDTLGNLFAGLAIQADQPFQVGDVIALGTRGKGVVEAVSWRGVQIRTFQNKLLVISNSVLGKELIEVSPKTNLNARLVFFNTVYSNSPAKTQNAIRDAVRQVENVSRKIRPIVRIRNLGDNGMDWEVKYWLDDYREFNNTDAQIRQRIWYVFQREGIDFAYPTRTLYVERQPKPQLHEDALTANAERLSRVSLFSPLTEDEIQQVADAAILRVYAPGESIVRQGRKGDSMYVVVRGEVKVQVINEDIHRTLTDLTENDFFGEMSLLTGEPRSATVVATEETELLEIGKGALHPILAANLELVEAISERVAERRRSLDETMLKDEELIVEGKRGVMRSIKDFFGLTK